MLEQTKNNNKDKKKGLGRGLGSLLSDVDATDTKKSAETATPAKPNNNDKTSTAPVPTAPVEIDTENRVWSLAIDKVQPNSDQPRQDFLPEKLEELSQSIKEQGILQPITVRKISDSSYEIIAGERRWRAAQMAGLHEVPAIVKKEVSDQQVLEWALIENIQREDLNPVEEAEAYHLLIEEHDYTHKQLAQRVGKDRATISNALRLLNLPPEVRAQLRHGVLSTGHAKALSSLQNPKEIKVLAKKIQDQGLSVRMVEKEVSRLKKGLAPSEKPLVDTASYKQAKQLSKEIQSVLGTRVQIDYKDEGKGKLTVHFYSDEELTRLANKLKRQESSL